MQALTPELIAGCACLHKRWRPKRPQMDALRPVLVPWPSLNKFSLPSRLPVPSQRPPQRPRSPVPQPRRLARPPPGTPWRGRGSRKSLQDGGVVQGVRAQFVELGVPLCGGYVAAARCGFDADGFGHAVGLAQGFDHEVGCHALDALVVDAVDAGAGHVGYSCARRESGTISMSWKCWS